VEEKVEAKAQKVEAADRAKDEKMRPRGWQLVRLDVKGRIIMRRKKKPRVQASGQQYNESLKVDANVRQLAYAPAKVYFQGLATVVGRCDAEPGEDDKLRGLMAEEHFNRADSDSRFEPPNFLIPTTSRIEYWAVADPMNGLRELDMDDWPKEQRLGPGQGRQLLPPEHFRPQWDEMNAKLANAGEPPLARGGFVALRLYTGPMFFKYNNVLRGVGPHKIPPLAEVFEKLCKGNRYTNTLHAITAAIGKLSRVTVADLTYRAPGGILPKYFWEDDKFGVKGGIEMGFMSTSRSKEAAMEYAKRSGVKLIFEVNQGMVARGADVSWLSMYPKEDEVLFPPMCACEVQRTRVEGSVVFVELRPGVAPSALQEVSLEQQEEEQRLANERRAAEARERKRAIEEAAMTRAKWMSSMTSVKVTAHKARLITEEARAAKAEVEAASQKDRAEKLLIEKEKMAARLQAMDELQKKMMVEAKLSSLARQKQLKAKNVMQRAQQLAQYMKSAALQQKLAENEETLKSLADASTGKGKIMDNFKRGLTYSKIDSANRTIAALEEALAAGDKDKEAMEAKMEEFKVRTLKAENDVSALKKKLAENKKMLDTLMK